MHVALGTVLGETYRVERLIGEGGMGAVYEASHTRVPRKFAVKFLNPQLAQNEEIYGRFRREAEIASSLGHQNIVQVFDFASAEDGTPYMVLEMLQGHDLGKHLRQRGALSLGEIHKLFEAVCDALSVAHDRGIVHRDLKPDNIFLCSTHSARVIPKILDFGISKLVASQTFATQAGSIMGTPAYMSPEQAQGRQAEIDHRTDVFALGAILYECIAGHPPFEGDTPMSVMYAVCHHEQQPLVGKVPHASPELDAVVKKALAKNRDERFSSVRAFFAELDAALGDVSPTSVVGFAETEVGGVAPAPVQTPDPTGAPVSVASTETGSDTTTGVPVQRARWVWPVTGLGVALIVVLAWSAMGSSGGVAPPESAAEASEERAPAETDEPAAAATPAKLPDAGAQKAKAPSPPAVQVAPVVQAPAVATATSKPVRRAPAKATATAPKPKPPAKKKSDDVFLYRK